MRTALVSSAVVLLSACSLGSSDDAVPPVRTTLVVTDRTAYDARLDADGRTSVVFDVPFEIHNTTGAPLYRVGCRRPPKPVLEKRAGNEWVVAYGGVEFACLSPPFVLEAGEVGRDTLRVVGYLPGQRVVPEFALEVDGTYRLRVELFSSVTDEDFPLGRDLVSLEERTSNTFEVRLE
ncbi:hypothetical protein [Rubrivirga sp.]|uniref:hypothetical protein n=1 Tax=Rubrivirga sp. TaxID=1885344 RepID=UPI003C754947